MAAFSFLPIQSQQAANHLCPFCSAIVSSLPPVYAGLATPLMCGREKIMGGMGGRGLGIPLCAHEGGDVAVGVAAGAEPASGRGHKVLPEGAEGVVIADVIVQAQLAGGL